MTCAGGCVLDTFASATPAPADPAAAPGPRDRAARGGPLLGLIRALAAYGQAMLQALQARNDVVPPIEVARGFGITSLALIIARITRGLMIAQALQERLRRRPATMRPITAPNRPASPRPASPRSAATRPARRPRPDPDSELPDNLPSAEEIARRIRNRPAGAVVVEICRDLGIDPTHPLWPEVQAAIIRWRGNLVSLVLFWVGRARGAMAIAALPQGPTPGWNPPVAAATQPP